MPFEPRAPLHLPPLEVAPDTFLLRSARPAVGMPLSMSVNSLVIRGSEPVIVDAAPRAGRSGWLADLTALVDLADVRWIFLSHDDENHTGNLAELLALCPHAVVVTNWAATQRMAGSMAVPAKRLRWIDDGDRLDVGDRVLHALRPPVYDSPTTRGVFDPTTRVYWASVAFATPMPVSPVESVDEIAPRLWAEGLAMFHHRLLAPWLALVDRTAYRAQIDRLRSLNPAVIVSAHSPVITGASVARALEHLSQLPDVHVPPHPDQHALETAHSGGPA